MLEGKGEMVQVGKEENLKLPKTAFVSSQMFQSDSILRSYDWAIDQREKGNCIISGFHSKIEKDVLHLLLKGTQPIILALARGLKEYIEPELKQPVEEGRLLIISPFSKEIKRVTKETALIRNRMMIELADEVVAGYASPGGMLEKLLSEYEGKKKITYL